MTHLTRNRLHFAARAAAAAALLATASPLAAQEERLTGFRTTAFTPLYQVWSFSGNAYQPTLSGVDSVRVGRVTQWSMPITVAEPLGSRWTFDLSAAYASTTVVLDTPDPELDTDRYVVSGLVDTRLRLTGRFAGDNLLVTIGYAVPTGTTGLSSTELAALRAAASPALGLQTPTLGAGSGATVGLVFARQVLNWAWAAGVSYEHRPTYAPVWLAAGIPTLDFNPSNGVHLSLAGDGILGAHGMTFTVSADFFGEDRLSTRPVTQTAPNPKLGPIYSAEWQFRVGTTRLRELTLFVTDRYRSSYQIGGVTVDESSGNYLDGGVRAVLPGRPGTGVFIALTGRHHTGLNADRSLATAAMRSAGLTLGVAHAIGRGYSLLPYLRGQVGRIKTGDNSANARELAAGITLARRF